jgi:hypothetical protein
MEAECAAVSALKENDQDPSCRVSGFIRTPERRQAITWVGRRINTIGDFPSIGRNSTVLIGSGQLATEASVFHPPLITPTARNGATLSVGNLLASLSLEPVMKTAAMGVLHRVMIAICIVLTLAFGVSCLCASKMMKLSTLRHISAPFASTRFVP